ncbi:hypothetical protein [Flavobacterium sp. GCM10027622]|uniref:hypothetical protein n=1 Tax=unclassified Flavobacterium TaxID=196869 RepID=UPI00361B67DF
MKANLTLFSRPLFLLGLLLLITNDCYFKYAFPGILTGKLSDFAGLFIFPYFFSVFMEKQAKFIYIATALFFIYWKLEMAQPFIDWLSSVTHLGVYRTVDVTDLIALLILPFSYLYFKNKKAYTLKANPLIQMTIVLISAFSFVATTLPPVKQTSIELESKKTFLIPAKKQTVLEDLMPTEEMNDTDFEHIIQPKGFKGSILVKIKATAYLENNTMITLKEINTYFIDKELYNSYGFEEIEDLKIEDFEKLYEAYLSEKYGSVKIIQPK